MAMPPIGAAFHRRSDIYGLVGWAGEQNLETVADLKDSTGGMACIEETYQRMLGCRRNYCHHQGE